MTAQTVAQAWSLIARWYSIPLLLLVWQVAVASGLVESRLLPSPGRVWTALATEVGNGTLIYHASVTVSRALAGFLLAALVGIPFAGAMARSPLVRNLFEPIFFIGYPIPKIALFPVFTYIFGIGTPSKIAFTFLECLYPIVVTCYFGFRGVQTRLIWSAQNCGASRSIILRRVILPATMPSIFSGLRVALPTGPFIGSGKGPDHVLVPRTRSSHTWCCKDSCELRNRDTSVAVQKSASFLQRVRNADF